MIIRIKLIGNHKEEQYLELELNLLYPFEKHDIFLDYILLFSIINIIILFIDCYTFINSIAAFAKSHPYTVNCENALSKGKNELPTPQPTSNSIGFYLLQ